MKKEIIEEIFEEIIEMLNFNSDNAESKEDFIERVNSDLNEMKEKYIEKAE
ncbi:MAG: hypothetical protein J1F28_00480 [Oscillospiraceae bacterium]|nr:hypothetical protein [Oscillospiraceae bacterium]